MTELLLSVPGITCGHCAATIRDAVQDLPGVCDVDVDVPAKTVRVTGTGDTAAVRAAITGAGYETA